jgi:hypothetical protein
MELMENGNFRLFAANGQGKRQNFRLFLQTENGSFFPWSAKYERVLVSGSTRLNSGKFVNSSSKEYCDFVKGYM